MLDASLGLPGSYEINVMIEGSCIDKRDAAVLWPGEAHVVMSAKHLPELLVKLGIYKTNSEARRAAHDGPIPPGFTMIKASKKVRCLTIWNPTKYVTEYDDEGKYLLPPHG